MSDENRTNNNSSTEGTAAAGGVTEAQHENGNGFVAGDAALPSDEPSARVGDGVGNAPTEHDGNKKNVEGNENRDAGHSGKPAEGRMETASERVPTTEPTGAPRSIKVEELPVAVRTRMDQVLHVENDAAMRQDARLINFLGEVDESQVSPERKVGGALDPESRGPLFARTGAPSAGGDLVPMSTTPVQTLRVLTRITL